VKTRRYDNRDCINKLVFIPFDSGKAISFEHENRPHKIKIK